MFDLIWFARIIIICVVSHFICEIHFNETHYPEREQCQWIQQVHMGDYQIKVNWKMKYFFLNVKIKCIWINEIKTNAQLRSTWAPWILPPELLPIECPYCLNFQPSTIVWMIRKVDRNQDKNSHNFNFAPQINAKQELNIDLLVRDNARKKTIAIKLHEHH